MTKVLTWFCSQCTHKDDNASKPECPEHGDSMRAIDLVAQRQVNGGK